MQEQIPLCADCGEVVNPETFEGCKCDDKCCKCSGRLHEHETGPNPSWKCVSCGTIQ